MNRSFYHMINHALVGLTYRVSIDGFDKIPEEGPAVIIANHVSYMDALLINFACKRPVSFIIDQFIYNLPIVNHFVRIYRAIPILPNREAVTKALEEVGQRLENGEIVCIFPEGRLTYTGHLGHFKPGVEWIIKKNPVPVYPVCIKGMWGSIFSRKYIKAKRRFLPRSFRRKVTMSCEKPIQPTEISARHLQRTVLKMLTS